LFCYDFPCGSNSLWFKGVSISVNTLRPQKTHGASNLRTLAKISSMVHRGTYRVESLVSLFKLTHQYSIYYSYNRLA
jgi:hypothetical protein